MSEAPVQDVSTQQNDSLQQQAPATGDASQNDAQNSEAENKNTTDVDSGDDANKEPPKGKNWHGRRIDELTRRNAETVRANEQLLDVLKTVTTQLQQPQPKAADTANEPKREQYEDWEAFIAAKTEWSAEQKSNKVFEERIKQWEQRQQAVITQINEQRVDADFQRKRDAQVKEIPDFEDIVGNTDIPVGNAEYAIKRAENPAKVIHYLAQNPDIAIRVAHSSREDAAMAVARIDASFKLSAKTSNAPTPGKPVGGSITGSTGIRDDMSMDEFVKERRKQMKRG